MEQVSAKVSFDEVLVHELLHYASNCQKKGFSSVEMEEEFAYGNSIEYLRKKKYTDEDIINNNFMPFLIATLDMKKIVQGVLAFHGYTVWDMKNWSEDKQKRIIKKHEEDIFKSATTKAFKKGEELIGIYARYPEDIEVKIDDGSARFNLLDL